MNSRKKIRSSLGLSQRQLADYHGVTCTQIGMWETGRRELPSSAGLKLAKLVSGLHHTPYRHQPQPLSEKECAALNRHAATCLHKARVTRKKLEEIQRKHDDCIKALAVIDHLQNNLPQGKEAPKDRVWLELLQVQTRKKLKSCGAAAQLKLRLNLQALELQAAEAGKMVG